MYHEKMVLAIKSSGKVLREFKDEVRLPFGTEYSLLIKNLHARRAMASIQIDGVDATEDVRLIIPANGEVELERFIKNGNLEQGNRFKFIERTARVEQARGIGAEDGLVRLEFEYECDPAPIKTNWFRSTGPSQQDWYCGTPMTWSSTTTTTTLPGVPASVNMSNTGSASGAAYDPKSIQQDFYFPATGGKSEVEVKNDAGITVPGSVSDQHFNLASGFMTDGVKHVIVLKLIGEVQGQQVAAPVTVRTRQKCSTCGHVNKATAKFCSECGTGLVLV